MVQKKKKEEGSVIVIIVFFLFTFLLRLFHYFDYKTWPGNKKKLEGVLIKSTWDSTAVAFAVLWLHFFLVKTFWFYDNHTTSK